jgi:hypothetical protein
LLLLAVVDDLAVVPDHLLVPWSATVAAAVLARPQYYYHHYPFQFFDVQSKRSKAIASGTLQFVGSRSCVSLPPRQSIVGAKASEAESSIRGGGSANSGSANAAGSLPVAVVVKANITISQKRRQHQQHLQ